MIHLIHSAGFYGAERMLIEHCQATPGEHRVLFLDGPAQLLERFARQGVHCANCTGLRELLQELRERPGVLNAHNFRAQVWAWIAAWRLGLPLILTQHGFTPRSRKQRLYTWFSLQLCRTRVVRQVVCVARSVARLHQRAGVPADKIVVIPNGLPQQPPITRQVQVPLVGFVGRLSKEKGPDLFLDALLPLCQQRPDLHLVLLGDGPERQALQQQVCRLGLQQRVSLPGYQENVARWLGLFSVLVISSRTEGTPMILLEAMQASTPVVAAAVGGIPDMLEDGRDALLVAAGDSDALGQQVSRLLDDPALAARLAEQARQRQLSAYHLPDLALRWARLYRRAQEGLPQ